MHNARRFQVDFTSISFRFGFDFHRFHFDFTSISHRFHFDFSSIHFEYTSSSRRFPFNVTSGSLRFHFDFISISLLAGVTSISLRIHCDSSLRFLTSISLRIHLGEKETHHHTQGKRENTMGAKGEMANAVARTGKGIDG